MIVFLILFMQIINHKTTSGIRLFIGFFILLFLLSSCQNSSNNDSVSNASNLSVHNPVNNSVVTPSVVNKSVVNKSVVKNSTKEPVYAPIFMVDDYINVSFYVPDEYSDNMLFVFIKVFNISDDVSRLSVKISSVQSEVSADITDKFYQPYGFNVIALGDLPYNISVSVYNDSSLLDSMHKIWFKK